MPDVSRNLEVMPVGEDPVGEASVGSEWGEFRILATQLFGNFIHNISELLVIQGVTEPVEHEVFGSGEHEVRNLLGLDLPHDHLPAEVGHGHASKTVDQPEHGDNDEADPPQPDDEEVLLVEEIVGEDAQIVALILSSRRCSYGDVAGNLCGEELAHGIVELLAVGSESAEISPGLSAVGPELVEKEHVADEHVEEDHADVEEFTEGELHLVLGVAVSQIHEVLRNDTWIGIPVLDDFLHEFTLHPILPEDTGHLGEADAEGEEERDPEIVGSHSAVPLVLRHRVLINKTSCRLPLEVRLQVTRAVDPAV